MSAAAYIPSLSSTCALLRKAYPAVAGGNLVQWDPPIRQCRPAPEGWRYGWNMSSRSVKRRSSSSSSSSSSALLNALPADQREALFGHHDKLYEKDGIIIPVCHDPCSIAVREWVRRVVVGKNLCPFAREALEGGQEHRPAMRVVTVDGRESAAPEEGGGAGKGEVEGDEQGGDDDMSNVLNTIIDIVQTEARGLAHLPPGDKMTSLVVCRPPLLESFPDFMDLTTLLSDILANDKQIQAKVQLATFHPAYQFADSQEDSVENFTNRSPFPVFHLLREEEVSVAIDEYEGDTNDIWKRNLVTMQELGTAHMEELLKTCKEAAEDGPPEGDEGSQSSGSSGEEGAAAREGEGVA